MSQFNFSSSISFLLVLFLCSCAGNQNPNDQSLPLSIEEAEILPADTNDLVVLKSSLNSNYYEPGQTENFRYLYLEVSTKPFEIKNEERKPLNICLVIDRSGSMGGDKLAFVKDAAVFVLENLNSSDFLSIVSYDDEVVTEWASGNVKDKTAIRSKIEQLFDRGGTNLGGGLLQGYNEVKTNFSQDYTNRVLLLTDGLANEGITDPIELNKIARMMNVENGISLSTFGVGVDYNEDLLQSMAENGAGNYYFIESPEDIPSIFKDELDGLLRVLAQNTLLEIELPQGVKVDRVFGFKYEQEKTNLKIHFRDLTADDTKGVLVKMSVASDANQDLSFSSKLKYTLAVEDYATKDLTINTVLQPTHDTSVISESRSKTVEQWVTFYEANYNIEKAMAEADKGNYDHAKSLLELNGDYLKSRNYSWGASVYTIKIEAQNSSYDSAIIEMEEMEEEIKKSVQKDFKSKNYYMKTRKSK
ncbi:MAG: VWA domain-containing protein [Bacteroidia bacterium]